MSGYESLDFTYRFYIRKQAEAAVLDQLRVRVRSLGRPVIAQLRRMLTPPQPAAEISPVKIAAGILAGCQILLPVPSQLAEKIGQGRYEPECSSIVQLLVNLRDVCYDIGAHYGYFTILFARLAAGGQVHCFEPVPVLADRIRSSASMNGHANVTVHAMALADQQRELTLRFAADQRLDDSMGYLSDFGGVDTERSRNQYGSFSEIRVPCGSLDQMDLPDPNFIKMDAEAAEAQILLGAREMLQRSRPRLLIEIHGADLALQCANLLGRIDYTAVQVMPRSENMSILWIHRDDQEAWSRIKQALGENVGVLFASESSH